ncbi:MAG: phosphatidylserine decarboxylase family protein [Thermodesulfobacteriota bacterium]|nr:phosphatidylserine decarboxylase family protein [Thermodesulfobacteriota bacterium]
MRKPSPGISLEGLPIIGLAILLTLTLALLGWVFWAFLCFILTAFIGHFFRDPERVVPTGPGLAVSPADGKVVRVGRAQDPLSGQERQIISIFMNVFDVHVNRSPVQAKVLQIKYFPGKFLNASLDKSSEENERNLLSLEDDEGRTWTVVQIAGLIARRIVCWVEEDDAVTRGQRIGLIKFGSRVDLYIPDDYTSTVVMGQKVYAGQTITAKKGDLKDKDE